MRDHNLFKYPWQQGRLLDTAQTRRWTDAERRLAEDEEKTLVVTHFYPGDEGRSREFVARCANADVARLVVQAPAMLAALKGEVDHLRPSRWTAWLPRRLKARTQAGRIERLKTLIAAAEGSADA